MDVEMMIISEKQFQSFLDICESHSPLFIGTFRMFAVLDGNLPIIPSMAGINFSGGENTLCADTCERFSISLPIYIPSIILIEPTY